VSKRSIVFLMMLTISSERMAMPSPFGLEASGVRRLWPGTPRV
jgi:hypothetical protein